MKRFIKNVVVFILSIPALLLMLALLAWSVIVSSLSAIIGDFKPYKWLDWLNYLFYKIERGIFK